MNLEIGKVPPQSKDAEEVVLGALLLEKGAMKRVVTLLDPESFYSENHATIYSAILDLYNQGGDIDIITVSNHLKNENKIDDVGGSIKIAQLTNRVAGCDHIETHAKIIKDKHIRRVAIESARQIEQLAYREDIDIADILSKTSQKSENLQALAVSEKKSPEIKDVMQECLQEYDGRIVNKENGKSTGVPSGFKELDDVTYGFQPTDYIVWAGRPSMGKSSTAFFSMRYQADRGFKTGMFSIEMSRTKLGDRFITADEHIDIDGYMTGSKSQIENVERSASNLMNKKIYIDDETVDIQDIRVTALSWKEKYDIDIIYIDYIGLIQSSSGGNDTRERQVALISGALKQLAKELKIPVVALSQLNRDLGKRGDKRPQLQDLRESGSLEQDADQVVFIHREEYYGNSDAENEVEIILAKNRNGALTTAVVQRNKTHTNYKEINPIDDITGYDENNSIPSPFPDGIG